MVVVSSSAMDCKKVDLQSNRCFDTKSIEQPHHVVLILKLIGSVTNLWISLVTAVRSGRMGCETNNIKHFLIGGCTVWMTWCKHWSEVSGTSEAKRAYALV